MKITKDIVTEIVSLDYTINKNTIIKNIFNYLFVNNYIDIIHTTSNIVIALSEISFCVNLLLLDELIKMSKKLFPKVYRKKDM